MKPRAWKTPLEFQLDDYRSFRLQTSGRRSGRKHRLVNVPVSPNFFFEKMARSRFSILKEIYIPIKATNIRNLIEFAISLAITTEIYRLQEANSQIDVFTREKQCRKSTFYDGTNLYNFI